MCRLLQIDKVFLERRASERSGTAAARRPNKSRSTERRSEETENKHVAVEKQRRSGHLICQQGAYY